MSRKHFNELAKKLAFTKPQPQNAAALSQWKGDVAAMAHVCSTFNPRFDVNRFYEACGATEETK